MYLAGSLVGGESLGTSYCMRMRQSYQENMVRPDQINLLMLRFFRLKIGPSDRKKEKKWEWLLTISVWHTIISGLI